MKPASKLPLCHMELPTWKWSLLVMTSRNLNIMSNRLVYIYTDTKIKPMVCITYIFPSLVKVLEAWLSEHPPLVGSLSQSERHSFSPGEVVDEKSTAPRWGRGPVKPEVVNTGEQRKYFLMHCSHPLLQVWSSVKCTKVRPNGTFSHFVRRNGLDQMG